MTLPPAYCLTMRQTPEREAAARQHFDEIGLDVEIVHGPHGVTAGFQPVQGHVGRPTKPGEVANALTHWWVWAMAFHAGHDEFIVLEDDAIFQPDFKQRFSEAYKALPSDWEVVYMGHARVPTAKVERINEYVTRVNYPLGVHAVLYKRSVVPYLRLTNDEFIDPIDVSLARNTLDGVAHYCLDPVLSIQRSQTGEWGSLLNESKNTSLIWGHW